MEILRKMTLGLVLCALLPAPSPACLWDRDTLASESARFPEVASIMTGLFPRHSQEYHTWRVQQTKRLIDSGSGTAAASEYDDLAVSQHKLGDHRAAIATMLDKERHLPGKYETYSNLGTFYIYTGELLTAIKWIDKALAINANAHFGREKYQRYLVLWLVERSRMASVRKGKPNDLEPADPTSLKGFAAFVARQEMGNPPAATPLRLTEHQRRAAIRGVTGMMYFADFDNPILQEALGDLLSFGEMDTDAAQLAALCYLQAAQKTSDAEETARLKTLMTHALSRTLKEGRGELQQTLTKALAQGVAVNADVRNDELAWIEAGKDLSKEFQKKYLPTRK